jgi:hypothetical protein
LFTASFLATLAGCAMQTTDDPERVGQTSSAISGGVTYNIKMPLLNNNCADVSNNSSADGGNVQEWGCNGTSAQNWIANDLGNGYFYFQHQGTNECLNRDTSANNGGGGGNVQQWSCQWATGSPEYQWSIEASNGHSRLVNRKDGTCLDVSGSGTAWGTNVQTWGCNGTNAQTFDLVPLGGGGGARVAAPYVPTYQYTVDGASDLATLSSWTGNNHWTLAFVITSGSSQGSWGSYCSATFNGTPGLGSNNWANSIGSLRNAGGDAIISFGGYGGVELAYSCSNANDLQNQYQAVINQFGARSLDFDVEDGLPVTNAVENTGANHMRNQVLANLQGANPGLQISFTLGVYPTGLPQGQLNVLIDAKNTGVNIGVVNIMAMDYGSCGQNMGQDAINAASAVQGQLNANGISANVGVTPMVGTNDTSCEYFSTGDAQNLVNYAQSNGYISRLAYWSQGIDSASYGNAYINIFKTFH